MKKANVIICSFIFLYTISVYADNHTAKLASVLSQISKVKTDLTQKERQQASIKQQLSSHKKMAVVLEGKLKKTTKNLQQQKNSLAKLSRDQAKQQAKLKDAQNKLLSQLRAAYQTKSRKRLKDIFGQKGISSDLILDYHRYIVMARISEMRDFDKILAILGDNKKKINRQTKELEKLEGKQAKQKLKLEKIKKEQSQLLSSLNSKIAKQNEKLKQLLASKKSLEQLVNTLVSHKSSRMTKESKIKLCKNFVWPTKGVVVTRFGSSIERSSWKWGGMIIRAPENQCVKAISSGKVVYADRLSGYGLLLIIDHGNGYMSLYGHNKTLLKDVNSEVGAGEVIAKVGKSDSEEHELYFGIRYNGKPINPEKWCESKRV